MTRLGLDIGATRTRAVLCRGGSLTALGLWPTPRPERLRRTLMEIQESALLPISELGVGLAGELDEHGSVRAWPNRSEYLGCDFRTACRQVFGLEGAALTVIDDCAAAALGEHLGHTGGGDETTTLYVGWGTGVGAGAVLQGRPYLGAHGRAFGLGHTNASTTNGVLCRCGRHGCVQSLVGGPALEQRARAQGWSGSALAGSAREGDAAAQAVLAAAAQVLGEAVAAAARLLDPHRVVLGGGLIDGHPAALEPIRRALDDSAPGPQLLAARFGTYSGAVGAALWTLTAAEWRSVCRKNLELKRAPT